MSRGGDMKKTGMVVLVTMLCSFFLCLSGSIAAEYLPDQIKNRIQKQAEERYPDNEVLQQRLISLQTKAYFKVQEYQNDMITEQEMNVIKGQAIRKFPENYVSQLTFIDKQAKKMLSQKIETTQR